MCEDSPRQRFNALIQKFCEEDLAHSERDKQMVDFRDEPNVPRPRSRWSQKKFNRRAPE